jgi:peptidoglycan hydrolase-like protein with peptidoglycan-binding domain
MALPTLRRGAGIRPQAPNPDVRVLQQRLGITADGQFGEGTQKAVINFQQRRGLGVDGVVGPETWAALFSSAA